MTNERETLRALILEAAEKNRLKKVVFSKPDRAGEVRTVLTPRRIGGRDCLQAETFRTDNKAVHENLPQERSEGLDRLLSEHAQINLLTGAGDCELRRGKRGTETLLGGERLARALSALAPDTLPPAENDRKKQYILSGNEPFLKLLGVSDESGRVRDKR
ncbi:MAG: hypothetical protein SOZ03_07180 [Eubacteriales bacterium]|nr:hypothetical protein [Eubacteriales bacterium]